MGVDKGASGSEDVLPMLENQVENKWKMKWKR